jgi:hypothetical protein
MSLAVLADCGSVSMMSVSESAALQPDTAGELYETLIAGYSREGEPLAVDFRRLVPDAGETERATHLLHPYPAKLLRHIPALMLSAPQVRSGGETVLDPFCGSGTVLVEAAIAQRPAIGIDINPLAVLVSRVKTTPLDAASVRKAIDAVTEAAKRKRQITVPHRKRLDYWYRPTTLEEIVKLRIAIGELRPGPACDLLLVALSATARQLSLANPRISVPVRLRLDAYPPSHAIRRRLQAHMRDIETADVGQRFRDHAHAALTRVESLDELPRPPSVNVIAGDAKAAIADRQMLGSVGTVMTSPPYLGAQKYIRASSLNLFCLDLVDPDTAFDLAGQSIGREHFRQDEVSAPAPLGLKAADTVIAECATENAQRAHLASTYLAEMRQVLQRAAASIAPNGSLVLVVGGNHLCGRPFDTPAFLSHFCAESGLSVELHLVDTIRSRGLMTRRNRQASPISSEHVMVFRK